MATSTNRHSPAAELWDSVIRRFESYVHQAETTTPFTEQSAYCRIDASLHEARRRRLEESGACAGPIAVAGGGVHVGVAVVLLWAHRRWARASKRKQAYGAVKQPSQALAATQEVRVAREKETPCEGSASCLLRMPTLATLRGPTPFASAYHPLELAIRFDSAGSLGPVPSCGCLGCHKTLSSTKPRVPETQAARLAVHRGAPA